MHITMKVGGASRIPIPFERVTSRGSLRLRSRSEFFIHYGLNGDPGAARTAVSLSAEYPEVMTGPRIVFDREPPQLSNGWVNAQLLLEAMEDRSDKMSGHVHIWELLDMAANQLFAPAAALVFQLQHRRLIARLSIGEWAGEAGADPDAYGYLFES